MNQVNVAAAPPARPPPSALKAMRGADARHRRAHHPASPTPAPASSTSVQTLPSSQSGTVATSAPGPATTAGPASHAPARTFHGEAGTGGSNSAAGLVGSAI